MTKQRSSPPKRPQAPPELPCPYCDAIVAVTDGIGAKCDRCGHRPVVCGRFRLTRVLGAGGMGRVYEAIEERTERRVAVKVMVPRAEGDWAGWELFERSSKVLRDLSHPQLPRVDAFERAEPARLILVREVFDGGTLAERIFRDGRRLPAAKVRKLLTELLELLIYLGDVVPPVVHRDIKPSNIMFRTPGDWNPVLVDFDTVAAPAGQGSGITIVGTPGYAAPEQFAADATPRSDLYGLGATMLAVVTHVDADRLPRLRGRFAVDDRLAGLDRQLREVLLRLVEPDPSARPPTARAALAALGPEPEPWTPPRSGASKRPLGFAAVAVGIAFGASWLFSPSKDEPRTSSAPIEAEADASSEPRDPIIATLDVDCTAGTASSCFSLGFRAANGAGMPRDDARAVSAYQHGCDLGDLMSCNNLAVRYENGQGVAKDLGRAADLYKKACDGDEAIGCRNLGTALDDGLGFPEDDVSAVVLYARACALGDMDGCNRHGAMYADGTGVARDLQRAATLYAKACDGGFLWGCRNLGAAYYAGAGVEQDERRAVALFRRLCDADVADGCYQLGRALAEGRGIERDDAESKRLLALACTKGVDKACPEK